MNNASHTKGPWHVIPDFRTEEDLRLVIRSDTEGVAEVRVCHQEEANARLIAAAPELLEACIQMNNALRGMPVIYKPDEQSFQEWSDVIGKATSLAA
jgi:hypothetical protein